MGNQNPYIEEEQTMQWPKKVQKDKQRSTKHTYKTKDRVTRIPLKTRGELRLMGKTDVRPRFLVGSGLLVCFSFLCCVFSFV
jgi:hypothetical protein